MMTTVDPMILDHFGDHFQGFPLTLKALGDQQWLVVLRATPACRLRLSAESDLTKKLDSMGLSNEIKIGDNQLDDAYVIKAESAEARALLQQADVRQALHQLSPFLELELTSNEYRLIREEQNPTRESFESTLNALAELVRTSLRPEGSSE